MLRKGLFTALLLVALAALPGCIIHDPAYYPYNRTYYYEPYYPYYYAPYYYTPFWFSGHFVFRDFDHRHDFRGHRGFDGRSGRGGGRR